MCGILGTLPKTEKNFFKYALDTLTHRGPDDYGIESIDNDITLGHRRLSIVDLSSNGHQPMSDHLNRYSMVFNGEIYNFIEIREKLKKFGYVFKSNSDSEVVLYSYMQWGDKCVDMFNGMWALAIWDNTARELFLSRDRFGKKPLFYAKVRGKFIFASEMKAIYPFLDDVRPSKDFQWMKKNIFEYESTDKCLIDGIKRFPAGHNGVYKNDKLKISRFWNTLDHLVEIPESYEEQVQMFRELFFDACRIRMRSDVAIGTALSGGLDSSATISAMANIAKGESEYSKKDWQHAFVASFPGTPMDESHYAKMVVENIDIGAEYVNIDPLEHWDDLENHFYMFEELYLTSPIPMLMTYAAVKKHGVSVTLDGHGADELFSGYGHLREALWDSKFDIKAINNILDTHIATFEGNPQYKKKNNFEEYLKFMIKKTSGDILGTRRRSIDSSHPNFKKLDNFSQQLHMLFHETALPTLLRNYDRYSMINSVEIRMPFLDHRIVSFVSSLPYSSKFGNGYTKKLIRDAMDPFMPKEITWRKSKIGFNSPIVDWMQGDLKNWFGDTVHSQGFLESPLVDDPKEIQKLVLNIIGGKDNLLSSGERAWKGINPYLWEKSIIKRTYDYK